MENSNTSSPTIEENKNNEFDDIFGKPNFDLFCYDCLTIPKYNIEINTKGIITLIHKCKKEDKRIEFTSEETKSDSQNNRYCNYCNKRSDNLCVECRKIICFNCQKYHIPIENHQKQINVIIVEDSEKKSTEIDEKKYFVPFDDIQFICKTHYIINEYFCPVCEINLCNQCVNYHQHYDCLSLFGFKVILKNMPNISCPDIILKNLQNICEAFNDCYSETIIRGRMSINIIMNYSIINDIIEFIRGYPKNKILNLKRFSNTLFNNYKEEQFLCKYFYDKTFQEKYANLIDSVNKGNYESYVNLEIIKKYYKDKQLYKPEYDLNKNQFDISLKGRIEYFRSQYRYINEMISNINLNISNNYSKKEIDDLKLMLKIYDVDINLLKKINVNLIYKYDFQLRRKIGNLLAELIISNYHKLLDPIEETYYVLSESIILFKKKLSQLQYLEGPDDVKTNYENDLKKNYSKLLERAKNKNSLESENIKKVKPDLKIFEENNILLQFHERNNEDENVKETILLNIFFRLRKNLGFILNHSIHNKTENINSQIKEEIEKINNYNSKDNKNEINEKIEKESEYNTINYKKDELLCDSYFQGIRKLRSDINIDDDIMIKKNENILKIFESQKEINKYIGSNLEDFKLELEKLFKDYEVESSADIKEASNLYFKGDISKLLSEKKSYYNKTKIKNTDSVNNKKNIIENFNDIDSLLIEYLDLLENMQIKALELIKQFEKYIKGNHKEGGEKQNPFKILNSYNNVFLFDIYSHEKIKEIYFNYLINFYFCAQDTIKYFKKIQMHYNEKKLIDEIQTNLKKMKILEKFDGNIDVKESVDLEKEWKKLGEEMSSEEKRFLNLKIIEYLSGNNINQFLEDLINIKSIKDEKIDLSKDDPQNLIIKAYWLSKKYPYEIPKELRLKKVKS